MTTLQERYYSLMSALAPARRTVWGPTTSTKDDQYGITSKIVDLIFDQAVLEGASDVHLEPDAKLLRVRYRIDGALYEVLNIENNPNIPIIPRIKVMANLETDTMMMRKPQDGRFTMRIGKEDVDFRVATFPTVLGEKVAIRVLQKNFGLYRLDRIGFDPFDLSRIAQLIQNKHGLLLVSGPTGSGKTTTLYAILNQLNSPRTNIITLEDPVEYQIPGMNQCDIKKKLDFNFADALRAALRQDPDILLVGEIRDMETAEIAIRASLTGHLVFTTLHANSAVGTVVRMLNMGIESYLVSYSLIGTIAQRLVRRICDQCRFAYQLNANEFNRMKMHYKILLDDKTKSTDIFYSLEKTTEMTFYKGKGCDKCNNTGYKGRLGVFEIIVFDDVFREAVLRKAPASELHEIALKSGTKPLVMDGLDKARKGLTSLEEVLSIALEK